jgi:hypothetical protein
MTRPSSLRGAPGLLVTLFVAALTAALSACGATTRDTVLGCTVSTDCGPAALCVQGACQASSRPVVDFALPASLSTNRAVAVTATVQDPDPGDSVAAWSWTITRQVAACEADADVADAATLQAVFWCAGTYQVSLVVTDSTGVESEPLRRTVTVTALPDAPVLTAGAAGAVDHRCAGTPLRCELAQPVALTADGQSPLGGSLTYQWTVIPPDPSRAGATARLAPSAASRLATLTIETDGGPISGAWRLRVRAQDESGNLAQATQLVTVGNRPPGIDDTPLALDHRYEAGAYRADGALAVPVSDPDGDPIDLGLELLEPAGSGCSAGLSGLAGASGTFSLSCPGPSGLLASGRALRATASDVNGATASVLVELQVRNRLPVLQLAAGVAPGGLEVDHSVGPCPGGSGLCFLASGASPFVPFDADGDPVTAVTLVPGVEADRTASSGQIDSDGAFWFSTPVARPAEFRAAGGASGFWLTATASDPFGASAPAEPLAVRILNRPPALLAPSPAVTVGHRFDLGTLQYQASAQLAVFADPDGDPLLDAGSTGDGSCAAFSLAAGVVSVDCRRTFAPASGYPTLSGFAGAHSLVARVTDGWEAAASGTALTITSTPPTVPSYTGAIEACLCKCLRWDPEVPGVCNDVPIWVADGKNAVFPVQPDDADGDLLAATFTVTPPSTATVTPGSAIAIPGACRATLSSTTFPVSVQVTVNDGVSQATGTWTATRVTCARAGDTCDLPAAPAGPVSPPKP